MSAAGDGNPPDRRPRDRTHRPRLAGAPRLQRVAGAAGQSMSRPQAGSRNGARPHAGNAPGNRPARPRRVAQPLKWSSGWSRYRPRGIGRDPNSGRHCYASSPHNWTLAGSTLVTCPSSAPRSPLPSMRSSAGPPPVAGAGNARARPPSTDLDPWLTCLALAGESSVVTKFPGSVTSTETAATAADDRSACHASG